MSDAEGLLADAVALLKGLVCIPSFSRQEAAAADFLEGKLRDWFPAAVVTRIGHNLVVDIVGEAAGPTLLLCSHIDTVAVAAGWTRDPFGAAVEGDRIYGLGANDAGASVVSMIAAARALGGKFAGRLLLGLVAEEEAGDQGFVKIEPLLPRYDAAIFGEPTGMGAAKAMRGSMRAILRSRGVACHASRPWQGKNAVDQLVADVQKLRAIDLRDGSPWRQATIEPTIVRGGDSSNQIPDLIETTLDIRTTPDKDNDWIAAQLAQAGVEIEIVTNRRRPMRNEPGSLLMQALGRVQPEIADYVFNGSCDMAFATAPSVVMGPGQSERSHAADEFIEVSELRAAVGGYRAVMRAFFSDAVA